MKDLGWANYKKTRDVANIVQMIPFSSGWKTMGVVIKLGGGRWRLYLKGTSEILTKKCTWHVIVGKNIGAHNAYNEEVRTAEIDDMVSDNISQTIIFYANQTLRTLLFAIGILTLGLPMGRIPLNSVIICGRNVDNIVTLYCLRRPSGRSADYM